MPQSPPALPASRLPARTPAQLPLFELPPTPTPWAVLDQRQRGTSFLKLPARRVLNSSASTGMNFWSINPYVGCEFGCSYCYARDTHRWMEERREGGRAGGREGGQAGGREGGRDNRRETGRAGSDLLPSDLELTPTDPTILPPSRHPAFAPWEAFERRILVKTDIARILAQTLDAKKLAGHPLVIGTATDPYQPAERRFQLTRQVLEVLTGYQGLSLGIITKSPLVTRDLDLLVQLASRHDLTVNLSLATVDPALARRLERRSPAPHARLRALHTLTSAGIHAGIMIAPILPGITDSWAALAALMEAAKEAGARYAVGIPLRLGPAARARFLPVLAQEFPELATRYRQRYDNRYTAGRDYTDALARRIRLLQIAHGFPVKGREGGKAGRRTVT